MAGTESRERMAVSAAYTGPRWAERVRKMSDAQVTAVYLRLKKQGKVN